jgi:hypothetical protein
MATWTDDAVVSYIKYIANSDEMFVILSPECEFKQGVGVPMLIGSPLYDASLFLFEKKEDADKFIDSRPEPSFGGIRPIGIINPEEELKGFIENLSSNEIEYVMFNANTDHQLHMKLSDVYGIAYGKDLNVEKKEVEALAFPIAENCEDFQKDEKSIKLIQHIIDSSVKYGHLVSSINLAYECSTEEMIIATNYVNGQILEKINANTEESDPDFVRLKELHFDCCISLVNKLMDRGDTYLICENDNPIINEANSSCCIALSTRYIHDIPHMCPVNVSLSLFEDLKDICRYVTITDGDEIGTTISTELLYVCMKYLTEEIEPNKLKFFMHYAFRTDLSMMGIELLYQSIICHRGLFDEVIKMIDSDEKFSNELIGFGNKVASDFYTEEGGCSAAYIGFIEYICDTIPDCS